MCAPYVEARPEGGARAEKEIGEKAQKIIRYHIVSTYFLHGAFKVLFFGLKTCLQPSFGLIVCTFVLPLNTLKTFTHYILCAYKKEIGVPSGSSGFLLGCKVLVMKNNPQEGTRRPNAKILYVTHED